MSLIKINQKTLLDLERFKKHMLMKGDILFVIRDFKTEILKTEHQHFYNFFKKTITEELYLTSVEIIVWNEKNQIWGIIPPDSCSISYLLSYETDLSEFKYNFITKIKNPLRAFGVDFDSRTNNKNYDKKQTRIHGRV